MLWGAHYACMMRASVMCHSQSSEENGKLHRYRRIYLVAEKNKAWYSEEKNVK